MAKISEYKGNPVIILDPEEKYPFSFGLKKATMILENIDEIEKFVDQYDQGKSKSEST